RSHEDLLFGRRFRDFDRVAFHSHSFMSTLRPRNLTPSASSRSRCSIAESPLSLISPPAPSTRCHGKPNPRRSTRATIRACPGRPAALATAPYVRTFPRGIARITRSTRRIIAPRSECCRPLFMKEKTTGGCPTLLAPQEGGDFDFLTRHQNCCSRPTSDLRSLDRGERGHLPNCKTTRRFSARPLCERPPGHRTRNCAPRTR